MKFINKHYSWMRFALIGILGTVLSITSCTKPKNDSTPTPNNATPMIILQTTSQFAQTPPENLQNPSITITDTNGQGRIYPIAWNGPTNLDNLVEGSLYTFKTETFNSGNFQCQERFVPDQAIASSQNPLTVTLTLTCAKISVPVGIPKVTAYLLFSDIKSLQYLENLSQATLLPDRLVLSFLKPNINLANIQNDIGNDIRNANLDALARDSGLFNNAQSGHGARIKTAISNLQNRGTKVYFAIGGWGESNPNLTRPDRFPVQRGEAFPLTTDIVAEFARQPGLNGTKITKITQSLQIPDTHTTKDFTDAWVKIIQAFGGDGADLDYEEYWFTAGSVYLNPIIAKPGPSWPATPTNGPFANPYAVIKFAMYIKTLKDSLNNADNSLGYSMAISPVAEFNIHDYKIGSALFCPGGNADCGTKTQIPKDIGGNIKGVFYDMAHYNTINSNYSGVFEYSDAIFENLLFSNNEKPIELNVMTYDLDDGYDLLKASWCITDTGKTLARDPFSDPSPDPINSYTNVDCSLAAQTKSIIKLYKTNVMSALTTGSGTPPTLGFGIEAGFPNYPVNIDASLPGGGATNPDTTSDYYRWNDKFIGYDIPLYVPSNMLTAFNNSALKQWSALTENQKSDLTTGLVSYQDLHKSLLVVNNDLFVAATAAGAKQVIIWSLNNADYNDHLSKEATPYSNVSTDYTKYQYGNSSGNWSYFAKAKTMYNYTPEVLGDIFTYAAKPEDILKVAKDYYASQSQKSLKNKKTHKTAQKK